MEPLPKPEDSPMGVAECLVNAGRVIARHGLAYVDDKGSISEDLATAVVKKAFLLEVSFAKPQSILLRPGEGQVGFIRRSPIPSSPGGSPHFAVVPITAKHNLRSYLDDAAYGMEARSSELILPMAQGRAILNFNDLNWQYNSQSSVCLRENVAWSFGIDISVGKPIESYTDGITSEHVSFQIVRPTFSFERGQRVGIAVYMKRKPTLLTASHSAEDPLPNVSDDDLVSVFGRPGNVNIYTGKITLAGDRHIEYDINSFTGCSGAIVFLLDENQPGSVLEGDHGKAVAVHGGAHPTLTNRNLGFKLRVEHLS
eukprot:scaffold157508_cov60-Attheya_sp.AAC.7